MQTVASGFVELGTLYVESNGDILVCDRGAHYVYRVSPAGAKTLLAGNGTTAGGGDGQLALATGLNGVRSIYPVPTGGYLLLTHDGCQLWYLDTGGIVHLLLNGWGGNLHAGDGQYFYSPEPKISEGRSVTMDAAGNMALGYSASDATSTYPSSWYTGRLASDPLGVMPQGEGVIINGSGSQLSTGARWGDYTSMNVDPVDDCTFWYINEYYPVTSTTEWYLRVGAFKFPSCGSFKVEPGSLDVVARDIGTPEDLDLGCALALGFRKGLSARSI